MTAIPVKKDTMETAVAPLFGKAKWIALVDAKNNTAFKKNETNSGREVVTWLQELGVKNVIFQHMGGNPFMLLQQTQIECYHSGSKSIALQDVLESFRNKELKKVDPSNMAEFVEQAPKHRNAQKHGHPHEHHHRH
jgi:predicted Fe-Mo cluster-binding NifX family protein